MLPKQLSRFVNIMKGSLRKRIVCLWSVVILSLTMVAQQEYFVFVQSDNSQPFYAKIGEKVYSASAIGHLVIPSLKDSTYTISIGFPKNQYPEIDFIIPINKKDQGYELKNLADQGWILFNLSTLQLLRPKSNAIAVYHNAELKKKTDEYSVLMAGIVDDTSVLYATVIPLTNQSPVTVNQPSLKSEQTNGSISRVDDRPDRPDDIRNVGIKVADNSRNDSVIIARAEPKKELPTHLADSLSKIEASNRDSGNLVDPNLRKARDLAEKNTSSIVPDTSFKIVSATIQSGTASIIKIREEAIDSAFMMEFTVSDRENKDTVRLVIASEQSPAIVKLIDTSQIQIVTEEPAIQVAPDTITSVKKVVMINSDCRNFASEGDVDKLRIKILAEKGDQEKIAAARKFYKNKCFTARQIRALSELFYIEEAKYDFLAASYPFVSDSENYRQLETLLSDRFYVEKFRNLFPP